MNMKRWGFDAAARLREASQHQGLVRRHGSRQFVTHPGLGTVSYPGLPVPGPYPAGMVRQDQIASMGAANVPVLRASDSEEFAGFNKIPSSYVISITLGGEVNDTQAGSVQLRPEPFILDRITWATTGDTYPYVDQEPGYSLQGRAVRMKWGDEFTKLFGNTSALIAAAFGDSNGFMDIIKGLLFQGGQTLTIELLRLHWPSSTDAETTQFDFVFSGLSLLPPGVNQSGSAG